MLRRAVGEREAAPQARRPCGRLEDRRRRRAGSAIAAQTLRPPRRGDAQMTDRVIGPVISASSAVGSRGAQMPILVVEDEPRILAFLRRGLEAQGFAVDAAADGATGLRRVRDARVRPRRSSTCCCRGSTASASCASSRGAAPELPVVILSARSDLQTKLRGFELGARDYVPKPFSLDELVARVRAQLRAVHTADADEPSLRAGPLELDVARRRARVGERVADLTDREFRLLLHLVRHAGEISQPRAAARGGLGLSLRSRLERRRRLHPAAAQEARLDADRDRPACGLSDCGGLTGSMLAWVAFALANVVAMVRWESWETIPFHFIWVSLTLLYGFRVWSPLPTDVRPRRGRASRRAR